MVLSYLTEHWIQFYIKKYLIGYFQNYIKNLNLLILLCMIAIMIFNYYIP